jgi:VCBS repeat-containing protein
VANEGIQGDLTMADMDWTGAGGNTSDTEIAQAGPGGAQPIGQVSSATGTVTVVHPDGSESTLNPGDPVYQGDHLTTSANGSVGITLADGTTFSMADHGDMTLDQMVYDPSTQQGNISLSVVEGVFTFVSGQVAKTDPDAMVLQTPVATIGIRGTQVGLNIGRGGQTDVVLMPEADGFVGEVVVANAGGVQILNSAMQKTNIITSAQPPAPVTNIDRGQLLEHYGRALDHLPSGNNANKFGRAAAQQQQQQQAPQQAAPHQEAALTEATKKEALAQEQLAEAAPNQQQAQGEAKVEAKEALVETAASAADSLAQFNTAAGGEPAAKEALATTGTTRDTAASDAEMQAQAAAAAGQSTLGSSSVQEGLVETASSQTANADVNSLANFETAAGPASSASAGGAQQGMVEGTGSTANSAAAGAAPANTGAAAVAANDAAGLAGFETAAGGQQEQQSFNIPSVTGGQQQTATLGNTTTQTTTGGGGGPTLTQPTDAPAPPPAPTPIPETPANIGGQMTGSGQEDLKTTITGALTITDVNPGQATFQAQTVSSAYGTFTLASNGAWTYALDNGSSTIQSMRAGATAQDFITVTSQDGTTAQITVTITGNNDAAVISGAQTGSVTEGDKLVAEGVLNVQDVDVGEAVFNQTSQTGTYGVFAMGANGAWTYTLNDDDTVRALPAGAQMVENFTVTSLDGTTQVVSVTVNGTNEAAVIGGVVSGDLTEDGPTKIASGALTITDADNAATFQVSEQTGDFGTFKINAAGQWTYELANESEAVQSLPAGAARQETFTILAADGTPQDITINVTGTNDAAIISGTKAGTVQEDELLSVSGSLTVTDVDGPDTFQAGTLSGTYGSLTLQEDGQWTYNLTQNSSAAVQALGAGDHLTDVITVTAADGTTSQVTITINGTNDAPTIAVNQGIDLDHDEAATTIITSSMLKAMDVDHSAGELTYKLTTIPAGGVLSLDGQVLQVNSTFTQSDIDAGKVAFTPYMYQGQELPGAEHDWASGTPNWSNTSTSSPNQVAQDNMTMQDNGSVTVKFQSEGAGYQNALGWYKIGSDGKPTEPQLIWTNASASGSGGSLIPGQSEVTLTGLAEGQKFGFFVIQDAVNKFSWLTSSSPLSFNSSGDLISGTHQIGDQYLFHAYDPNLSDTYLNDDQQKHTISGLNSAGDLQIGFEDLTGGGDRDFDDLVISLHYNYETAVDSFNFTVTDADGATAAGTFGIEVERAEGNDYYGTSGRDTLTGGSGDDYMSGGNEKDTLYGGAGHNLIAGGSGDDKLYGQDGHDTVYGGDGVDYIEGNAGNDILLGEAGKDTILGGTGGDSISGGTEDDILYGEDGTDIVYGDAGKDTLYGGNDNDKLYGGAQDDKLYGGAGTDTLEGGTGNDTLWGEGGSDVFVFHAGDGTDTVMDFGVGDQLVFEGAEFDISEMQVTQSGTDAIITFGGAEGVSVKVKNTDASDIASGDGYSVTQTEQGVTINYDNA